MKTNLKHKFTGNRSEVTKDNTFLEKNPVYVPSGQITSFLVLRIFSLLLINKCGGLLLFRKRLKFQISMKTELILCLPPEMIFIVRTSYRNLHIKLFSFSFKAPCSFLELGMDVVLVFGFWGGFW